VCVCVCVLVDVSAKIEEENEVTPFSNYVSVNSNGWCIWEPRFELSVTHCDVDVTWFPFDDQTCDLVFESWTMTNESLDIVLDNVTNAFGYYHVSDEWKLLCTCVSLLKRWKSRPTRQPDKFGHDW